MRAHWPHSPFTGVLGEPKRCELQGRSARPSWDRGTEPLVDGHIGLEMGSRSKTEELLPPDPETARMGEASVFESCVTVELWAEVSIERA